MTRLARNAGWGGLTLAVLLGGLIAFGLAEAVADPIRREASLTLDGLLAGSPSYRVALLSDIHVDNRAMQPDRLERIVAAVNQAKPDLVVIVGDFVNGQHSGLESDLRMLVAPLSGLRATNGVVATLGNHDHWTDPQAVEQALRTAGVTVLRNQSERRGPLMVLGIDDYYSGHDDVPLTVAAASSDGNRPTLAISHSPDLATHLPEKVPLLLAGHTHCGQVVLPVVGSLAIWFGRLVGDAHYFEERYQCGEVTEGLRTTIVTAGLGSGSIPVRLGAPPDWWLVTLNARSGR